MASGGSSSQNHSSARAVPAINSTTATLLAMGYSLLALTITSTVLARRDVIS